MDAKFKTLFALAIAYGSLPSLWIEAKFGFA